jgi:hypothetical protein
VLASAAAAATAVALIAPAEAGGHGFGHGHPWGLGRGLVGAVVGLATLPIAIASAALLGGEPQAPYDSSYAYDALRAYVLPPAYYPRGPALLTTRRAPAITAAMVRTAREATRTRTASLNG